MTEIMSPKMHYTVLFSGDGDKILLWKQKNNNGKKSHSGFNSLSQSVQCFIHSDGKETGGIEK